MLAMVTWHLGRLRRSPTLRWLIVVLTIAAIADLVSKRVGPALPNRIDVVVASRDLDEGVSVPSDAVRIVSVDPGPLVPRSRVLTIDDVVGRIPLEPIYAGEPLRPERLAGSQRRGPGALLRTDERGVSVAISPELGVPLATGDVVSVFATPGPIDNGPATAVVTAARVLVRSERAVTLAVPLREVPLLAAALVRGPVTVALRLPPPP